MKSLIAVATIAHIWLCYAPPVTKNEKEHSEQPDAEPLDFIHYSRYLKQVVNALESDPGFKKKLEEANEDDIKSGKIAHELDFVSHHVRTKLDELKRVELERLLDFKHQLLQQGIPENEVVGDPLHGHLDRSNKQTFEIYDLKKLIIKTTNDLEEADRRRREDFKTYELQKEFEKQDKLNHTNGADERLKLEKHYKELDDKHKKHEPLHEPGHKAQLEEVWQKEDHMQQQFDPRTFFMMHDVDSNDHWDQNEVKALFIKELNKLYEAGAPEDDLREREEEMERMRETVFKEMDANKDGLISRMEFLQQTQRNEFEQDHGWKSVDQQRPYSDEELQEYIRQQKMLHSPPGYHAPQNGYYPPPPGNYHPNQIPQGYPQQPPPNSGQYYQGQQPPQYQQGQQPPQYQQGQQPPQYQQGQQPPQYQQGQQPPQYQQGQQPPQHQQQPQPPQYQGQNHPPPPAQYQQPHQPPVPNQPVQPPPEQQPIQGQPVPPQGQQHQQINQPPPQNQPSPQVNPHAAGQPVQAP